MVSDFWIVLQWWGTLFLVGAIAWPLTKRLFADWFDHGYLFAKAVGMATVTWIVFVLGTLRVMPFSVESIGIGLVVVFFIGLVLNFKFSFFNFQSIFKFKFSTFHFKFQISNFKLGILTRRVIWQAFVIGLEEVFFLIALFFWSWIKAHEPSIRGLEKFMDFGFMQSILNSQYFPPADMWYAGSPINYYYFGHMVVAVLTRLSGLDLAYTFNLMLATIFALTLTMSFSIGYQLARHSRESGNPVKTKDGSPIRSGMTNMLAGILTAFLVTIAGNMQTIYAFTKGYTGENVKPFWELGWKLKEGLNVYWYANATRFIPFTIHEFPSYSFVVSDVHGHVLSIPFVLLAIGLLIAMSLRGVPPHRRDDAAISNDRLLRRQNGLAMTNIVFYGFLVGVLLMTNALDGPIYFALFALLLVVVNWSNGRWQKILQLGIVGAVAIVTSLPFLIHFKSFVTGVAVNCPPTFLSNTKFGPLIFEGVEKCQISPFWMWWLLWGFFVYCGGSLIVKLVKFGKLAQFDKMIVLFFLFALVLVIVPEFFYFKDIYPAHFRSNTMFKLGYEAFILFSIVAGYTIATSFKSKVKSQKSKVLRMLFLLFLLPQLFLVSIFPIFAVRSYFNSLKRYQGIYGLNWLQREYSDDWEAIQWLNTNSPRPPKTNPTLPPLKVRGGEEGLRQGNGGVTLVEADGDSYTDYGRFSAFTGIPTIIGWPVHEWLWRGSYDVVAPRREEVRIIYESEDIDETKKILAAYNVSYIVVGKLEREKYKSLQEWKLRELGPEVFRSGSTIIYAPY